MIASTNPFEILAPPLASLLAFFYDHVMANYGVAIILMTLTVMIVLAPLTWKGTRSMLAMQRLQPEIKRLQQQHKNDKAALNEAMMAFYKEHQINPLGGCLPLVLQMPVFFGLFRAVSGLTKKSKGLVQPKFISSGSRLYHDLTHAKPAGSMKAFGIDLAKAASAHHSSFWAALPYLGLVAGIIFTGWYQQRQLTSRNKQAAQANPQAQLMQKIFPIFFGLITYRFPAGVALYWLAQSVARIIQQWAMYRWDPSLTREVVADVKEIEAETAELDAPHAGSTKAALVAPPEDGGRKGWFARMLEAASTQREAKGPSGPSLSGRPGPKTANGKPANKTSGAKPTARKPPPVKPAATKPPPAKPPPVKPAAAKPTATKPTAAKPPPAKPPPAKPAAPKPTTDKAGGNGVKGNGQPPRPTGNRPPPRKRRGR